MLALDEAGPDDATYEAGGYTFCVNKELIAKTSTITIDYGYMGFSVDSEVPVAFGGGSCSSCSTGCSSQT